MRIEKDRSIFISLAPITMKTTIMTIIFTILLLLCLDGLRLGVLSQGLYQQYIGALMLPQMKRWAWIIVWVIMGICYALLITQIAPQTMAMSLFRGWLIGFSLYAVYNFTNLAILKDYPRQIALIDTTWGLVQWILVWFFLFTWHKKFM